MPLHNTKGSSRGKNNGIRRASLGLGPSEAFKNAKTRLFKVITRNFYNSHIALVEDPSGNEKLGDAKREIDNSTCLILARADVARLAALVAARRKSGITAGNSAGRSIVYDSGQAFDMMCWGATGKGIRSNGRFQYIMLQDRGTWYIHHLEGATAVSTTGGILSPSELEPSDDIDEDDSFDYEDEETFEALRDMFEED